MEAAYHRHVHVSAPHIKAGLYVVVKPTVYSYGAYFSQNATTCHGDTDCKACDWFICSSLTSKCPSISSSPFQVE